MRRLSFAILGAGLTAGAFAQTFGPGAGGAIPDGILTNTTPGVLSTTINVAGAANIASFNWLDVTFTSHTWSGDVEVELVSPGGVMTHAFARVRGTGTTTFGDSSDLIGTYRFVDSGGADFNAAAVAADAITAIAPGTYNRSTTLADQVGGLPLINNNPFSIYNGTSPNGVWTLNVRDWAQFDTGTFGSWSFNTTPVPEPASMVALGIGALALLRRRRKA
ncbi:MAG: PEP-CTERM sorting domain-containing protein [Fimbriimonadaceae bacterium]